MAHAPQSIERFAAHQTARSTEILQKLFSQPIASDREFKEAMLAILPAYFGERLVPEVMETVARHTIFRAAAMEVFRNAMAPALDTTPDLRHIRVPTLVLSGRHDFIAPADLAGAPLARGIPGAWHQVFEASGHFPFAEEPDRFQEVMARFLAEPAA